MAKFAVGDTVRWCIRGGKTKRMAVVVDVEDDLKMLDYEYYLDVVSEPNIENNYEGGIVRGVPAYESEMEKVDD